MIKTLGIFFDGISSNPQEIEICLNEESDLLVFDTLLNKGVSWHLNAIQVEHIGAVIEVKPVSAPLQSIKIDNAEFICVFLKLRKEKGYVGFYHKLINLGLRIHAILALIILGSIAMVYLFVLPWVAEKAVVLVPESYENALGVTFFDQYVEYSSVDTRKTEAMMLFAGQLNLNNTKKLKFTVVNSETVNAFALPDGNIIIFTGIIDQMKDYDELAGLIGHEVAHVNNRHSMKMMCRNLAGYIFLSAVLSDVNGIVAVIGDNIHTLQSLTYSRHFEREADIEGMEMLVSNKIDPKGMSNLFLRLQTKYDNLLPEFLSSHPITKDRIEFIDNTIAKRTSTVTENAQLREFFLLVKQ